VEMVASLTLSPAKVLALDAHPDDIELGCGGSLVKLHYVRLRDLFRDSLAV